MLACIVEVSFVLYVASDSSLKSTGIAVQPYIVIQGVFRRWHWTAEKVGSVI